jgi:hypothetical protein
VTKNEIKCECLYLKKVKKGCEYVYSDSEKAAGVWIIRNVAFLLAYFILFHFVFLTVVAAAPDSAMPMLDYSAIVMSLLQTPI